jgi:RNA recognition motif-containing protein
VYVGELSDNCTTDQLLEFFKKDYDSAFSANIIMGKGYGFVKFTDREEARRAIEEMSNQLFQGKRIKVRESFQKNKLKDGDKFAPSSRGRDDRPSRGRDDRFQSRGRDDRYGGGQQRGRRSSFDSYDSRDSPSARRNYGGRGGADRGSRGSH